MEFEEVTVTPKLAAEMLGTSLRNRKIINNRVQEWLAEMEAGRWFTGPPLLFDVDGHLFDGHHRLKAVLLYGKSVKFIVLRGVASEVRDVADTGRPRTFANWLEDQGMRNTGDTAATTYALLRYRVFGVFDRTGARYNRHALIDEYARCRSEIEEGVRFAQFAVKSELRLPKSQAAALYIVLSRLDGDRASEFFDLLISGISSLGSAWPLTKKDPVYLLRSRLLDDAIDRARGAHNLSLNHRAALVFKAWNAWIEGREVGVLKYDVLAEEFPVPTTDLTPPPA